MAMMPFGEKRLEKLDVLLLVAIILIFPRRAGLCNVQMAVFRWSVIAVNQALSVQCKSASNILPANMGIEGLFELNATRLGQLQRALLRLAKPGFGSVAFLLKMNLLSRAFANAKNFVMPAGSELQR